ncbi:hypothetical protein M514_07435 [Trichuris suis]|uniref:Strictosidine synthase conserved region domain-containing protein n=1 Tax=Trichuris suis TaxID=68888 RepID=A0A085NCC8_9BILA|nr:hypothetical protein M513_07435 [Trichuris suis]KFD67124.1 hypothetical protein M514_07435 [Trichuris suis]
MEVRQRAGQTRKAEDETLHKQVLKRKSPQQTWFRPARWCFLISFSWVAVVTALAIYAMLNSPQDAQAQIFRYGPPVAFDGKQIELNRDLEKCQTMLMDKLAGPESIVVQEERMYTGTLDGKIVEIVDGKINQIIRLGGKLCEETKELSKCGRPLGMRSLAERRILVADAYLGIYDVDFNSNTVKQLVAGGVEVDGKPMRFINDLDIIENTIYFTHSSTRWDLSDLSYLVLEGKPDGRQRQATHYCRLMAYDMDSDNLTVVLDNLRFPNGVQASRDEDELFVAETGMARILRQPENAARAVRLPLKSKPKGVIFLKNLHCLPDNIRLSMDGNLWVACAAVRTPYLFYGNSMLDWIGQRPNLRNCMIKFIPRPLLVPLMGMTSSRYGLALLFDEQGKMLKALHDPDGKVLTEMKKKPYVIPTTSATLTKRYSEAGNEIKSKKHVYMVPAESKYTNPSAQGKWTETGKTTGYMAYGTRRSGRADGTNRAKFMEDKDLPGDGAKTNRQSNLRRKLTCDLFWQKNDTAMPTTGKSGRRNRYSGASMASQNPEDQQTGISAWMTDLLSFGRTGTIENTPRRKTTRYSSVKRYLLKSFVGKSNEPELATRFMLITLIWITCAIICIYATDVDDFIRDWYYGGEKYPWETTRTCFYPVTLLKKPNYKG